MTRRAFSLLEVMLATAIATSVLFLAVALFTTIDRTDHRLSKRYETVMEMGRVRTVVHRALGSLVMSEMPREFASRRADLARQVREGQIPDSSLRAATGARGAAGTTTARGGASGAAGAIRSGTADSGDAATGADGRSFQEMLADYKPRIHLMMDPRADGYASRITDLGRTLPEFDRPGASRLLTSPQRFELVLSESPMAVETALTDSIRDAQRVNTIRRRPGRQRGESRDREEGISAPKNAEASTDAPEIRAVRGAFELRPAFLAEPSERAAPVDPRDVGWELWWVPLPPALDEETPAEGLRVPDPVRVARGISYLQWRVFQGRERRTQYEGRFQDDIPAYVELEVEMVDGLKGNWLIELAWSVGAEVEAKGDSKSGDKSPAGQPDGTSRSSIPGGKGGGGK